MEFYFDDSADDDLLVSLLEQAGPRVYTPRIESLLGEDDPVHLAHAAARRYTNLLVSGLPIVNEIHVLNHWR